MTTQFVDDSDISIKNQVEKLEASVKNLLELCTKLSSENEAFKNSNSRLMQERSELQLTNDKVRAQIEAMVERLKSLDKAT